VTCGSSLTTDDTMQTDNVIAPLKSAVDALDRGVGSYGHSLCAFVYTGAMDGALALHKRHTPCLTPHTLHLTPHTSHLTPHTSHLTSHASHLTPHTSHLTLLTFPSFAPVSNSVPPSTLASLPLKRQAFLSIRKRGETFCRWLRHRLVFA
jgi:hypothetical protein